MTLEELKANYTVAYQIIRRERAERDKVFGENASKREERMHDMDVLLEIIDDMKNELKRRMSAELEQPRLLDVPRKAEYA